MLKEFFEKRKIEYFGVLDYDDCPVTFPELMAREDFTPRSVILFLVPYYTGKTENISIYAQSYDYHIIIKMICKELEALLKEHFPDAKMKGYGDHSPIAECQSAAMADLGVMGENMLLINEKYGSYVFIGDLISDIDPTSLGAKAPKTVGKCIGCNRCKTACPTGILRGESIPCLSAITQRKGELSGWEMDLMRKVGTAWGCDECQKVCPYNENPIPTPLDFFYEDRIPCLTRERLASLDKSELARRAFSWRGRRTVERNLDIIFDGK